MTERIRLQDWLGAVEIPAGLETDLLAGVRQRRRTRRARTAAQTVTTVACLLVAATVLPWDRLAEGLGVVDVGPAGATQCRSDQREDTLPTGNGLLLEVQPPKFATVGQQVTFAVLLTNVGDRAVDVEFRGVQLCVVGERGIRRDVAGTGEFAHEDGTVRADGDRISLAPGSANAYILVWTPGPCREPQPVSGCRPDEPLPPGSYQVYGSVRVQSGGRLWDLTTQPGSMLVEPDVKG